MEQDRVLPEEAEAMLQINTAGPDTAEAGQQTVHVFVDAPGILLGTDWPLDEVKRLISDAGGATLSGPLATKMGHGLVVHDETGKPRFLATKDKE